MARQIQGSQRDFSAGEIDISLKRADDHPARKAGLRQMANARILNSGAVQNRPGRRALFPISNGCTRIEKITMSAGHNFKIAFGTSRLQIIDDTETVVFNDATQGNGAALPWTSANLQNVVYAVFGLTITITFPGMRPQVLTWDGVATWSIADYTEQVIGSQKRTPFYRIAAQGISLVPSASTGAITVTASQPMFTAARVGTRIRYIGRQILITGYTDSQHVNATVEEALPGSQTINFTESPADVYSLGDELIGSVSGSKGLVTQFPGGNNIVVQLLSTQTSSISSGGGAVGAGLPGQGAQTVTQAFVVADYLAGPGGRLGANSVSTIQSPQGVAIWDEEVMNLFRGYPASVFADQFRLGFCGFPSVPGGIAWSAINSPSDLYVGPNPGNAMFEIVPAKARVQYVVPGPESSEFVFCDQQVYYIPISETNPLKPGSVAFKLLSGDGAAQVQPRISQEAILYVNAGQNSVMAIIATGAYLRPFNTKNLSDFHGHLFNAITAIAVPNADSTFNERYAYVLNGDGSIVVGKYSSESLTGNAPVIGWGPWSGVARVFWIAAWNADVFFTTSYFEAGICEVLDGSKYLDCSLAVNALPAPFTPPGGKGPLWLIPGQTVTLMDQVTRMMGTYQIDANGFVVPQFNGGEDLTLPTLIAGQPWTMTVEPFAPDAQSGVDMQQRMLRRRISNFAAYVVNSTGFTLQKLFSRKETATSPALGTPMAIKRVPAWNVDDNQALPPKQRETVESWRPMGHSFDPRVAIVKDTPGSLQVIEIGIEVSL